MNNSPRFRNLLRAFVAAGLLLLAATAAPGGVALRWQPQLQVVAPGDTAVLSLMLEDTLDVRTIDVVIDYDPAVLTGLGAVPGALFDTVSCYVWPAYEEDTPGHWHAFAAIIGASCQTTGPGELLRWSALAAQEGWTDVSTAEVTLYDPAANRYEGVTLPRAVVGISAATSTGGTPAPTQLELDPNPFNPRTRIGWTAPPGEPYRLELFDLSGRRLAVLAAGTGDGSFHRVTWYGRDGDCRPSPSGLYLFRLAVPHEPPLVRRGLLVR